VENGINISNFNFLWNIWKSNTNW